jgi:hypothetical protein
MNLTLNRCAIYYSSINRSAVARIFKEFDVDGSKEVGVTGVLFKAVESLV